ncbi:hypothetical protein EST38_g5435 [Candolleomyces aberdarensis]|uniref:MIOS-like alpha-solenoid domain-containing protein n=1 Tax=Candolleomyces aberdarensis TaxID=2316362 RepID=A0A4Q2DMH1_9AGAR|nr:hypothetical protein EST38_g5435 [Candolleomyces aberdarensis]
MVYLDKSLLWHPRRDNKFIVGGNSQITLYEWAAEYPEIRHITSQHDLHYMKCFAWSPDPAFEDLLAVGHSTGKVDLIRLEAPKQARQHNVLTSGPSVTLPVRTSRACNALAFCTTDPNYLAVGLDKIRNDSSLIIWDINAARAGLTIHGVQAGSEPHVSVVPPFTPRPHPQIPRIDNRADTRTLQQHGPIMLQQHAPTEVVSSLSFLPHSTHLLLAGVSSRWLRLFDLRSSSTPSVTNVASKVHGIATDTFDAHRIACFGDNQVTIWDARRLSQPLLMFTERDGLGDGAKLRQGAAYSHIEFSRTRRGCLSTLERDGNYVRFWDVTETRHPSPEGSNFGGSSDGESRTGRESNRSARRSWAANLPWPTQNSNASRAKDSPTLPERQPYASYVLADTRRTKTFSRPLASFAMVPDSSDNPLACHVMVVNKDGDLELYQVHDTPKQGAWSSLGDLTVGAGKGFKVFEGFRNHESTDSDGVRQPPTRLFGEKDPSRSRSATGREDSQLRGRASQLYPPPSSALFGGDHEGFPPISGVSAQLAMSARGGKPRTYSPLGRIKVGERSQSRTRSGVPVAGIKRFTESRSRERHRSPSAAGRKSSRGPELKSKGITSVLAEDISMVMHRRAMIGYGLSKPHENMLITENPTDLSDSSGQDLSEVWAWIYHSRELLCSPTPRVHGYDFSYQGLIGIWEGFQPSSPPHSDPTSVDDTPTAVNRTLLDIPGAGNQHERQGSSRRSYSPADDLHGNWAVALTTIAERRGVDRSLWKPPVPTTKLVQRQVALQLCGWSLKDEELKTAVKRWEREGKLTRAACWLVFTKQHTRAIDLLMQSSDPSHQMMSGTIAALLPHSSSALKNPELRQHYSQLTARVKDPYLKMMLTHMAVGDWAEVLKENKIPFRERLAIAFQFLDDKSVTSTLRRMTEAAYQQGDIEGLIITGLTKSGLNVLQAYVDKTGDVQTAAIMSSYVCPVRFKDNRAEKWLQTYRDLLDGFKLHHERVGFDIERGQLLSDAIQNGFLPSEEWVPRQILIRCHYCNKPVNGAEMLLPNQFPQKGRVSSLRLTGEVGC